MNLGSQLVNNLSVMPSSSATSWKSTGDGGVPDQFPVGLRVLVVDDDPTCLMILQKMLQNCNYEVTKCNRAEVALSLLRGNKNGFDIVLSDVHMPDMDGFKLLEHIGLEMDLPVIMMSADDSKSVVMKGVTHGACDYLIKPVRIEALRNIWQHVVRRKKHEWKDFEPSSASADDGDRHQKPVAEDADYSSSANEGHTWKNSKRRKDEDDEGDERDDSSSLKKPRVVWSVELHQQFVAAVNQLGIDTVPKKILELMNVPGLTRENVASHLQKYRLYLRRLSGSHHPGSINPPFMGDSSYGSINGLDQLQALAATGQLPSQSLATLQAAALGRSNNSKSPISVPLIDQRNIFSFENPKLRYGESQSQHLTNGNTSKQMNLLHGIPTNINPKQHSFGGMNSQVLIPMGSQSQNQNQSQSQSQTHSNTNHHQASRQPVLPNGILTRGGVNTATEVYSPMVLTENSFSPGGSSISSHLSSTPALREDGNLENKVSRGGVVSSYDIFDDLHQNRSQNWSSRNVNLVKGLTFDSNNRTNNAQGGLDMPSAVFFQHNSRDGNVNFLAGEQRGAHRNGSNVGQQHNTYAGDNLWRVKVENFNDESSHNTLYPEQYAAQDDLLAAILKQQQQGGIGQTENEFGFDGYALDNLPV